MIDEINDRSLPTRIQRENNCLIRNIHGYDFVYQGANTRYCVLFSIMHALHNFSNKNFSIMNMMHQAYNIVRLKINTLSLLSEPFKVIEEYGVSPEQMEDVIKSLNLNCIYSVNQNIINIQELKNIKEKLQNMPDSQFAIIVVSGHAIMYKNEGQYSIFINSGINNMDPYHTINPVDIYEKTKLLFQLSLDNEKSHVGVNPSMQPISHKFKFPYKAMSYFSSSPFNKNLVCSPINQVYIIDIPDYKPRTPNIDIQSINYVQDEYYDVNKKINGLQLKYPRSSYTRYDNYF